MKRLLVLLILIIFCISGCGSATKQSADMVISEDDMTNEAAYAPYDGAESAAGNKSTVSPEENIDRKIIKNAEIKLRVEDIEGAAEKIKNKTIELKGYPNDFSFSTNERNSSASLSLKVPEANYTTLFEFIVSQGKADYKREHTNDVTMQYIDLDARVNVLKAEEESLLNILNKAEKIDDILKVKAQITSTRQERESLEGQLKVLNHSIEYSTINVTLYKPQNSDVNVNIDNLNIFSRSWGALIYGFNSLASKLGNIIVLFFTALPTLVLLALIIFAFVYMKRRRKEEK